MKFKIPPYVLIIFQLVKATNVEVDGDTAHETAKYVLETIQSKKIKSTFN